MKLREEKFRLTFSENNRTVELCPKRLMDSSLFETLKSRLESEDGWSRCDLTKLFYL